MNTRLLTWYSFLLSVAISGFSCGEAGLVCGKQSDCTQPGKPICSVAVCLACSQDQDCKDNWKQRQAEADALMMSMMPVGPTVACEASTGTCRECLRDEHCADARPSDPLLRSCDLTSHTCVGCVQDSDCMANAVASRDGLVKCENHQCIDCNSDNDCTARPGMTKCADMRCSVCAADADCASMPAPKKYCARPTGAARSQCGECKTNAQCTSDAKPFCNTATLTCESCTGKAANFCEQRDPLKPFCDPTGTCAPCTKHEDCASGICYRVGDYAPPAAINPALKPGQCVPTDKVVKVTPATIANEISGTMPYLKLDPGTYPELTINREVVLVGSSTLSHKQPGQVQSALSHLTLTGGRTVLYDLKVEATATGKALITCGGGAKIHVRLARLLNSKMHRGIDGFSTGTCGEVLVNQAYFNTQWEGIMLTVGAGTLPFVVQNSQFVRCGSAGHATAVYLGSGVTGTFAFNMLYGNTAGLSCAGSQTVGDTAICDSGTAVNGCTELRVAKTCATADYVESPAGVFRAGATFGNMLVDAAVAPTPALPVDFFGDPRPKGTKYDIGSEEIR